MVKTILFPSSYFSIRNVDEDLKAEYDSAIETGLFDIVLFFMTNGSTKISLCLINLYMNLARQYTEAG